MSNRVLITDGLASLQREVTRTVMSLGHEVVAAGASRNGDHATFSEPPDVALVIVGENSDETLELIRTIVREAACPVIAILDVQDRAFIDKAARLGIFSSIAHAGDLEETQSSIDIALQRFAEYHALEDAFGRRAVTERAKGDLDGTRIARRAAGLPPASRPGSSNQPEGRRRRRIHPRKPPTPLERSEPIVLDDELLVRTEDDG